MIDKLLTILKNKKNGLDAVALVPGPNFRHVTGGQFFLMERPFEFLFPQNGCFTRIIISTFWV